jgi:ribosomal protein S18 acetylase RimI-like enzyme
MLAQHHEELSDQFTLAWDGKRKWAKYLEERFSEISTKLIVAEEEEEIVGFMLCLLSPNAPVFKDRKIGVISDVYVLEERRRKGVAKNMLNYAIKWFEKNKVRSIQLGVAHDNYEARAAWRQVGFSPYVIYKRLDLKKLREKERTAPKRVRKVAPRKKVRRRKDS